MRLLRAERRLVTAIVGTIAIFAVVDAFAGLPFGVRHAGDYSRAAPPSGYLEILAAVSLFALLPSLARGKANARRLALVFMLVLTAVAYTRNDSTYHLLLNVVAVGCLFLTRRFFRAPSDQMSTRQGFTFIVIGVFGAYLYGALGVWFLDSEFSAPTSVGDSLSNGARLLFFQPTTIETETTAGEVFLASACAFLGLVFAAGILLIMRPPLARNRECDHDKVVELLNRWGTTTLAHFHLLEDKIWFVRDHGFVGYRLVGSTAVVLGDPIGDPQRLESLTQEFLSYCDANGWDVCFHQLTSDGVALLTRSGMATVHIGDEAVIDLRTFDAESRPRLKSVRNNSRKLLRDGMMVEELEPPIADGVLAELKDVSDSWLGIGGHRERFFTLGNFDEDDLRRSKVIVARSSHGRVEAFVNVIPSYRSDLGNFDLMRRRVDSPSSVMDLLLLRLIDVFRRENKRGLALGLAPLSNLRGDDVTTWSMRIVFERGMKMFNFAGLRSFTDKWGPEWQPRYLGYRSSRTLPRVAMALSLAGEENRPVIWHPRLIQLRNGLRLVNLRPWWFLPVGLAAVVMLMQLATHLDPTIHSDLFARFGTSPEKLGDLELYRLLTANLLQVRPDFFSTIVGILAVATIAGVFRLDGRVYVLVWFLADIVSSLFCIADARFFYVQHTIAIVVVIVAWFAYAKYQRLRESPVADVNR